MPTLRAEKQLFPDDLFTKPIDPAEERQWWLAHTKPRQEKALARELLTAQLPYYLPCIAQRTKAKNRVQISYLPLFNGYAFLHMNDVQRPIVYSTRRVIKLTPVVEQERLWNELSQITKVLALGTQVTPELTLQPGTPIVIRSGPLMGLSGTIVKSATGDRFVVSVDLIQQGMSVTLDADMLGTME